MSLAQAIITVLSFVFSALPLHFAVKVLGGKTDFLKTLLVAGVSGLIVSGIKETFRTFGAIIAFFVLIWVYREMFRMKWHKAFFAWLLQFVFLFLFYVIAALVAAALIGVSILALLA